MACQLWVADAHVQGNDPARPSSVVFPSGSSLSANYTAQTKSRPVMTCVCIRIKKWLSTPKLALCSFLPAALYHHARPACTLLSVFSYRARPACTLLSVISYCARPAHTLPSAHSYRARPACTLLFAHSYRQLFIPVHVQHEVNSFCGHGLQGVVHFWCCCGVCVLPHPAKVGERGTDQIGHIQRMTDQKLRFRLGKYSAREIRSIGTD